MGKTHGLVRKFRGAVGKTRGLVRKFRGVIGKFRGVIGKFRGVAAKTRGLIAGTHGFLAPGTGLPPRPAGARRQPRESYWALIGAPETWVRAWYFSTNMRVVGPGLPVPMTRPSSLTTGMSSAPVPVRKHSSALNRS